MSSLRERAKAAAQKAASGGSSYIKPPEGAKVNFFQHKVTPEPYALDFLPYEVTINNHPEGCKPGDLWFSKQIWVHYGIGADDRSYVCRRTIGEACPICEAQKLLASDASVTKAEADKLLPKQRTLFQIIDLDNEEKGIQLWELSHHLFNKKLMQEINKTENSTSNRRRNTAHAGFADLNDGQTLMVSFIEKTMVDGKGNVSKFPECDRIDAEPRAPYEEAILDETFDLDSIVDVLSYEKLEEIFMGGSSAATPEPEQPVGTRGARRGAAAPAEEPEPATGRRARGAAAVEPEPAAPATGRRARGAAAEPAQEPEPAATGRRGRGAAAAPAEEPAAATSGRRGRGAAAEPEPAAAAAPAGRTRAARGAAPEANPCPYGFRYGIDCELKDECIDQCPEEVWTACKALKEGGQ